MSQELEHLCKSQKVKAGKGKSPLLIAQEKVSKGLFVKEKH